MDWKKASFIFAKRSAVVGGIFCSVLALEYSICFAQTVQVYETTANKSKLLTQQASVSFSSGTGILCAC